jgi:mannose-6-phosphate isomerase-like protein (cupin superfamily)
MQRINLDEKFGLFTDHWRPKIIAAAEFFMVWKGRFRVEFSDHVVELGPGECLVVPRGIEHRTCADEEAEILLIEPTGLVNTGNVTDAAFTAPTGVSI